MNQVIIFKNKDGEQREEALRFQKEAWAAAKQVAVIFGGLPLMRHRSKRYFARSA